jgi:hypothetical protein
MKVKKRDFFMTRRDKMAQLLQPIREQMNRPGKWRGRQINDQNPSKNSRPELSSIKLN